MIYFGRKFQVVMRDSDIRKILHSHLNYTNQIFDDTLIVDELDLCSGLARIDVAVINGSIHGYEIKSEEDTLIRLPNQIKYYNKTLEKISVAINPVHLNKIQSEIPSWWGILVIEKNLEEFRKAEINTEIDGYSMLQLLWKDELIYLLEKYDLPYKKNLNRKNLGVIASTTLDVKIISQEVRELLKSRKNWRN